MVDAALLPVLGVAWTRQRLVVVFPCLALVVGAVSVSLCTVWRFTRDSLHVGFRTTAMALVRAVKGPHSSPSGRNCMTMMHVFTTVCASAGYVDAGSFLSTLPKRGTRCGPLS